MISAAFQPYFVLAIIVLLFIFLYKEVFRPSISFLIAILAFLIGGVLDTKEVLNGLSNQSIASILIIILITKGLQKNYNVGTIFNKLFTSHLTYRRFLLNLMSKVAILSSFINNTPVVAIMTPYVVDWGRKNNIAPSKLLIPLSYATIMGGMITIIGTSTTLVLNGFLIDYGLAGLRFTDLLITGGAVTLAGILFIALVGYRFLPNHMNVLDKYERDPKDYIVETQLSGNSKLIGQSVKDGGLRNLKGVYLVEIIRNAQIISPVSPNEIIHQSDVLIFAGDTDKIVDLINSDLGVRLPKAVKRKPNAKVEVIECVVGSNSNIINHTVKDLGFRNRYDAAVIAIHRGGEKLSGKIGDIQLKSGDLLLVYAGQDFLRRIDLYHELHLITRITEFNNPGKNQLYVAGISALLIGILWYSGNISLFSSLLVIFSTMIGFKMITLQDLKRELDFDLVAILVFSLALGEAMIKTGAAEMITKGFLYFLRPYGFLPVFLGVGFLTTILTSFITNIGAVSIAFPLAYSVSNQLGISGEPFYLAIAYASSAAFLTPISYQTNLIIFGPGGYNFRDFFKAGLPVTIVYLLVTFSVIVLLYKDILLISR